MDVINYYTLDKIEKDADGLGYTGWKNGQSFEVFPLTSDESENEQDLADNGFAKCDAPDWDETMVMEESSLPVIKLTEEDLVNAMVDFFGS